MKTIYKSLMTIAFAGLCLASCDKELKEDTAMTVGSVKGAQTLTSKAFGL